MSVFDLSEIQAQYILDTPLRRLTRFDRLELEREREQLQAEIDELTAILDSEARLREVVSDELASVSERFATPRRTVLLEGSGVARTAAVPLEVEDDPCTVLLSSAGLLARTAAAPAADTAGPTTGDTLPLEDGAAGPPGGRSRDPSRGPGPRAAHDVIVAAVDTTARGTVGLVTSHGRLIRLGVLELPALPPSARSPALSGGAPLSEFVATEPGETVVGLAAADTQAAGLALGTAQGVVKRVAQDYPQNAAEFEVISLKDGDRVVGAVQLAREEDDLVFITSDAQLLRFPAATVRPQGRAAGGMSGVRLAARASVVWFGVVDPEWRGVAAEDGPGGPPGVPVVVTVAGAAARAARHHRRRRQGHPLRGVPGQGPGHRRGALPPLPQGRGPARAGLGRARPARGATEAGSPVELPPATGRRDGSGERVRQPVATLGGTA